MESCRPLGTFFSSPASCPVYLLLSVNSSCVSHNSGSSFSPQAQWARCDGNAHAHPMDSSSRPKKYVQYFSISLFQVSMFYSATLVSSLCFTYGPAWLLSRFTTESAQGLPAAILPRWPFSLCDVMQRSGTRCFELVPQAGNMELRDTCRLLGR
jgi:hypothetical protein